jgi:hypothetical protein
VFFKILMMLASWRLALDDVNFGLWCFMLICFSE